MLILTIYNISLYLVEVNINFSMVIPLQVLNMRDMIWDKKISPHVLYLDDSH